MNAILQPSAALPTRLNDFIAQELPTSFIALFSIFEMNKSKSTAILELLPLEVKQKILDIADSYKKNGHFIVLMSNGEIDHTDTAKALYELLVREHILAA